MFNPFNESKIYVASSWRNAFQPAVVETLIAAGFQVYDFKSNHGFHWSDIDEQYKSGAMTFDRIEAMLANDRAKSGFARDYLAMQQSDTFVLVLPSGRSAHLELGWAIGQGKRTAILNMENNPEPDLMVLMADYRTDNLMDLLAWLGVED